MSIKINNSFAANINKINHTNQTEQPNQLNKADQNQNGKSFQDILLDTVKQNKAIAQDLKIRQYALNRPELTVSKHARQRAEQRNIDIDNALDSIDGALIKAAGKNLKNVLVLSDDAAFIVSVGRHANVVVTAMSGDDMRENVITNIDGTVII